MNWTELTDAIAEQPTSLPDAIYSVVLTIVLVVAALGAALCTSTF
jgi:hypothetical protein